MCLFTSSLRGQDSHFSMYYAPTLELNPATTGQFKGYYRAHIQYRDQSRSTVANPYQTAHISVDKEVNRFGYGMYIQDNKAGITQYNTLKIVLSGAYEITQDYRHIHHLSTGVQLGAIQKSINPDATYNNQYDKDYEAGGFDKGLSSGESFTQQAILLPEINYGLYYYKSDPNSRINPSGGISLYHLSQPKETYSGASNKTPIKWNAYGSTKIKLKEFYHIEPSFLYARQNKAKELVFGALFNYEPDNLTSGFFIGPYYRTFGGSGDAIQIHSGISIGEYIIRFSYDITTSTFAKTNGGKGAFEVSITYTKHKGKYIPSIL